MLADAGVTKERGGSTAVPWSLSVIFLILLITFISGCCPEDPPDPVPPAPEPQANLIIDDERVTAWMTVDNSFAGGDPKKDVGTDYWTGILFQLGANSTEPKVFKSVVLEKGGVEVGSYILGKFSWINVVSESGGPGAPVGNPDAAFGLYPSENKESTGICTDPGDCVIDELCLRGQRLYCQLVPGAILTYWPNLVGYKLEATAEEENSPYRKLSFSFDGEFSVDVYNEVESDKEWHLELLDPEVDHYDFGDVDLIQITYEPKGPQEGLKKEPPFPNPPPPPEDP